MKNLSLSPITLTAIEAALKAGKILQNGYTSDYEVMYKSGKQNIVTSVDKESEQFLISFIRQKFPNDCFLAEESGYSSFSDQSILWIIDPLDGTTNFARHIPIFTISLAAYYKCEALCGVIYQPLTNELFVAEKDKGAYLNGQKLCVSSVDNLKDSLMISGFSFHNFNQIESVAQSLMAFNEQGVNLRSIGSAALSLAYVAAGKAEACWIHKLYPWDLAAGKLIVEEAGGRVSHLPENLNFLKDPSEILATNGVLHYQLLEQIQT